MFCAWCVMLACRCVAIVYMLFGRLAVHATRVRISSLSDIRNTRQYHSVNPSMTALWKYIFSDQFSAKYCLNYRAMFL